MREGSSNIYVIEFKNFLQNISRYFQIYFAKKKKKKKGTIILKVHNASDFKDLSTSSRNKAPSPIHLFP